jgi:hypothetical protein
LDAAAGAILSANGSKSKWLQAFAWLPWLLRAGCGENQVHLVFASLGQESIHWLGRVNK